MKSAIWRQNQGQTDISEFFVAKLADNLYFLLSY